MKIKLLNEPDYNFTLLKINISDQVCGKNVTPDLIHLFVKSNKEFEAEMKI